MPIVSRSTYVLESLTKQLSELSLKELRSAVLMVQDLIEDHKENQFEQEKFLLLKIKQGLNENQKKMYQTLKQKRDKNQLRIEEAAILKELSLIVEKNYAENMQYLIQLALIKNISVTNLVRGLDLDCPEQIDYSIDFNLPLL